jgi:hypothetical protein
VCKIVANLLFSVLGAFAKLRKETVSFIMSKNVVETEWPQRTSQQGAYALRAGITRPCARMRMYKPTRSGTHKHARTRKHAHTGQYVIHVPIAFPQQQWFRERTSVLRYAYIACLVFIWCVIFVVSPHFIVLCVTSIWLRPFFFACNLTWVKLRIN